MISEAAHRRAFAPSALMAVDGAPSARLDSALSARFLEVGVDKEADVNMVLPDDWERFLSGEARAWKFGLC